MNTEESRGDVIGETEAAFRHLLRTDPVALAAYQSANHANLSTTQTLKFLVVTLAKAKQAMEAEVLANACAALARGEGEVKRALEDVIERATGDASVPPAATRERLTEADSRDGELKTVNDYLHLLS